MPQQVFKFGDPAKAAAAQKLHEKEIRSRLKTAALDAALQTQAHVVPKGPRDTGLYANSWDVAKGLGDELARLVNDAPYAGIIELGARPYRPPFTPIFEWVKRNAGKLGIANVPAGGTFGGAASLNASQERAARAFAWGVVKSIEKYGLKPRYIMRNALPVAQAALKRAFEEHLGQPLPPPKTGGA